MSINTVQIDTILERLALQESYRFNAYQIAALSNEENIEQVNNYMLFKAQFGVLRAMLELFCPENHPDFQLELGQPLPKFERECHICDGVYIPDIESSHVVFYFQPHYTEEVKKKYLLQHGRRAI